MTNGTVTMTPRAQIDYPKAELKDLRNCLKKRGFLSSAVLATGIAESSIKGFADNGRGQWSKVNALREYVKQYKQQTA